MKINTTITIEKIGGRKLILSNEEAHELYKILHKELGMENKFKKLWEETNNDINRGYFQEGLMPIKPSAPEWPWKTPHIICGTVN
jgi:hypothetical protein